MSKEFNRKINRLFNVVQTPGQYIGGEFNQIRKEYTQDMTTVALAFPDTYAIGTSHLGLAILYAALNQRRDIIAERVFCPWLDAAEAMRREGIPLFSWESRRPVRQFDILGITLQHELSYSNILYMLDLAGISFRAADRDETEPLVVGGGPMSDCCEPVADFFDFVILGDGEDSFPAVIDAYRQLRTAKATRREILLELARQFDFVYVPQLYQCSYNDDGTLAACQPTEQGVRTCVQRALVEDLDAAVFPTAPIIPHVQIPHDRIAIEIMRGCPQRCAFCHAGHTRGPLRYRSVENILDIAWQSYLNTGHDTISLLSLSTSDYPNLADLAQKIYQKFEGCNMGISLPSLRVDRQLKDIPAGVTGTRREGLTVAVETASDKIRRAIGKRVTDTDLMATMTNAFQAGWRRAKLYFMVGFPGETQEDIDGIVALAAEISNLRRQVSGGPAMVTAAVSWLVPKPHTPFGWIPQQSADYFYQAKHRLIQAKRDVTKATIKLKFHHMQRSLLEGVLARGDRRLSRVIELAYRNGAHFDCWDECFDYQLYTDAFEACDMDPAFYAHRQRSENEVLPWDHLAGDNRQQLYRRATKLMDT